MPTLIPITESCNQNCLFCSAKGRNESLVLSSIFKIINQENILVSLSGGEPTLSPDLFRVIKYAKGRGLSVELQSNGVTLSYFDFAERLTRAGVDLFNINFPSHLERESNLITQTKGFYPKRMKGLHNLEKLKAKVRLTHVINSRTIIYLEEFVDFLATNLKFILYIQFSLIKNMGSVRTYPELIPEYEKVGGTLLRAMKKCKKNRIDFLVDHIPPCYLSEFYINHVDILKSKNEKFNQLANKEKSKIKQCAGCRLEGICWGVRKDHLDYFGEKMKVYPVKFR